MNNRLMWWSLAVLVATVPLFASCGSANSGASRREPKFAYYDEAFMPLFVPETVVECGRVPDELRIGEAVFTVDFVRCGAEVYLQGPGGGRAGAGGHWSGGLFAQVGVYATGIKWQEIDDVYLECETVDLQFPQPDGSFAAGDDDWDTIGLLQFNVPNNCDLPRIMIVTDEGTTTLLHLEIER